MALYRPLLVGYMGGCAAGQAAAAAALSHCWMGVPPSAECTMPTATSPAPAARSAAYVSRTVNQHTAPKPSATAGVAPACQRPTEMNSRRGVAE